MVGGCGKGKKICEHVGQKVLLSTEHSDTNNNNNNNILYLDTLSREETLFKGEYIGTIIGYTN